MSRKFDSPYTNHPNSLRVKRKVQAYCSLCGNLENVVSVKDYFGGLGYGAATLCGLFPNASILVQEISTDCLNKLRASLIRKGTMVTLKKQDFFEDVEDKVYDLAVLDWNTFTILQYHKNKNLRGALHRLPKHKFILFSESAVAKFHINRTRYGLSKLGGELTLDEYIDNVVKEVFPNYGLVNFENVAEVCYVLIKLKGLS